ncbi:MAG TPA: branched-chain amino acid ABC transporter permease [Anaeromyxobacteraceae bacterium]|nr:branched-chain amino acid ABC transporter permease [Anaeromyxobacteraceae bacterium]
MAQQVVNGVFIGSIYALFALGYTLVFGVLDILNLAHQAVFMLCAFVALTLVESLHLHPLLSFPIAVAAGGAIGIALERVAFRPLRGRANSNIAGLISSIAVATIVEAVALAAWGPDQQRFPFGMIPEAHARALPGLQRALGISVTVVQIIIFAIALLVLAALTVLVRRTRLGRQIRAVAENPTAARILGVNVDRVIAAAFFVSSALGAAAGVLYGVAYNYVAPDMGRAVELKGLAIIILGGMGSMPGAVIAAYVLALCEVWTVAAFGSSYRDVVSFAVLFLILLLRPRGLLGAAATREA